LSAKQEQTLALLCAELQHGPVPVTVLLEKAIALGLNREYLKNAKRALGIVALRDREPKTARTLRWRWSLPTHAPISRPPLIPHRWGLYSYHSEGRYYFKRAQADTFKTLLTARGLVFDRQHHQVDETAEVEVGRLRVSSRQHLLHLELLPRAAGDDRLGPRLKDGGDPGNALKILMRLCEADLRCLDAHAHLGNLIFQHRPAEAIRHYQVGLRIGELSLGDDFDGVLPWGLIDNRPFLRCLHNFGLCCWRLGRLDEVERVFDRMLWLNPSDNQGARLLIGPVRAGAAWEQRDSR